jgi:hypothetical protein
VFVSIISVCIGIDFACTYIDSKKKDSYGAWYKFLLRNWEESGES